MWRSIRIPRGRTCPGCGRDSSTPTSSATNRLSNSTYDAAGNLTAWNTNVYEYDRFNQMTRMRSGSEELIYLYTAGDERIWIYDFPKNQSRWTLRDLDGKVLREYRDTGLDCRHPARAVRLARRPR